MILEVELADRKRIIEIAGPAGRQSVVIDGAKLTCDWLKLADGHYSILLDGRVYDLSADSDGESCCVGGPLGTLHFRVRDPRRLGLPKPVEEGTAGLQRVHAEMPGKVIRVLVQPGDSVAYDQGMLVIEAMKMQNEIRAPKAGKIRELAAKEGKTVNSGEFLLSLE